MPSSMSPYLSQKLHDHVLRNIPYTPPPVVYIALYTGEPANGAEMNYDGYARRAVTFGPADATGKGLNTNAITFPANAGDESQTATHIAIVDALTGGNWLYAADLQLPKTFDPLDYGAFAVGSLSSTLEVRT